jgi:hypothetical protein
LEIGKKKKIFFTGAAKNNFCFQTGFNYSAYIILSNAGIDKILHCTGIDWHILLGCVDPDPHTDPLRKTKRCGYVSFLCGAGS